MTWEEIGKKYDREKRRIPLLEREPKLEKNWGELVRSTDKLVWLFIRKIQPNFPGRMKDEG